MRVNNPYIHVQYIADLTRPDGEKINSCTGTLTVMNFGEVLNHLLYTSLKVKVYIKSFLRVTDPC